MARATQRPQGIGKPWEAGVGPVTVCGGGQRDMGREAESAKQQPRGNGKPVAMEW